MELRSLYSQCGVGALNVGIRNEQSENVLGKIAGLQNLDRTRSRRIETVLFSVRVGLHGSLNIGA
jgi:hypothetical protein